MRIALVLLVCLLPAAVLAQEPAAPASTLLGRVTASADNGPLRRARLAVIAAGVIATPVYTDQTGAFELPIPPDGSYQLAVRKAGYAPLVIEGPRNAGQPIVLSMVRGAVIRGQVTDMNGDPAVGVMVSLRHAGAAQPVLGAAVTVDTDDRGEFRFGNLAAGRYEVRSYRGPGMQAIFENVTQELARRMEAELKLNGRVQAQTAAVGADAKAGEETAVTLVQNQTAVAMPYAQVGGVVTGVLVDEFGEPAENTSVRLWITRFIDGRLSMIPGGSARAVDDRGRYRLFHIPAGRYVVAATPAAESSVGIASDSPYLSVYFPGRFDVSSAAVVQVDRASEAAGIDMVVPRSRGGRVFGVALSAAGTPLKGDVRLVPSQSASPIRMAVAYLRNGLSAAPLSVQPAADGTFEITGVPPGYYAVQAMAAVRSNEPFVVRDTRDGFREQPSFRLSHIEGITEFTMQRHSVAEGDVGPLILATVPTTTIRGRVTVDGPGQRITPADFTFTVAHADPDEVPASGDPGRPDIVLQPDGRFEIAGLTGRARIVLTRGPAGWWLKSVKIGGANAAEEPVNFDSASAARDDVTMVLSPTGATLAGRVTSDNGDSPFTVVIFPVDRELRISGSRFVRTTSPSGDGRFELNSFPPAAYHAVAVEEVDGDSVGDWENPEQLEALAEIAQRVTLGERDSTTIELRLQRAPR